VAEGVGVGPLKGFTIKRIVGLGVGVGSAIRGVTVGVGHTQFSGNTTGGVGVAVGVGLGATV